MKILLKKPICEGDDMIEVLYINNDYVYLILVCKLGNTIFLGRYADLEHTKYVPIRTTKKYTRKNFIDNRFLYKLIKENLGPLESELGGVADNKLKLGWAI